MTFRAIVRDGMININTHGELPDGAVVEVVRVERPKRKSTKPRRSTKGRTPKDEGHPLLPLAGIWKNRPEWKGMSTLEIHRELRAKAMGGRRSV